MNAQAKSTVRDLILPTIRMHVPPEKLFRMAAISCLVGSGSSAIYLASHVGSQAIGVARAHDFLGYFGIAFGIFSLFYIEHRLLRRSMSPPLGEGMGHAQGLVGLAFTMAGAVNLVVPFGLVDYSGDMLWAAAMSGECILVLNAVRSYSRDEVAGVVTLLPTSHGKMGRGSDNFGWPQSPVKLFAIGAGVLAGGGVLSIAVNIPAMKLPVPFGGQVHLMPVGCLWLIVAVPFIVYAWLYKRMTQVYRIEFDQSMNRVHFLVTVIAVIIFIKAFTNWQETLVSPLAALYLAPDLEWLAAPFILSTIVFMLNVYRSFPRTRRRALVKR